VQTQPERPKIERRRPNTNVVIHETKPDSQSGEKPESKPKPEVVIRQRRNRVQKPEIASNIRVPMGTKIQNDESKRRLENRQNTELKKHEGGEINSSGDKDRSPRREIAENISERRPGKQRDGSMRITAQYSKETEATQIRTNPTS